MKRAELSNVSGSTGRNPTEILSVASPSGPGIGSGAWWDEFGAGLALSGNSFFVGAIGSGLNPDNPGGRVYRFDLLTGELLDTVSGSGQFRASLAVSDGTLAVGAPRTSTSRGSVYSFAVTALPEPYSVWFTGWVLVGLATRLHRRGRAKGVHFLL